MCEWIVNSMRYNRNIENIYQRMRAHVCRNSAILCVFMVYFLMDPIIYIYKIKKRGYAVIDPFSRSVIRLTGQARSFQTNIAAESVEDLVKSADACEITL